MSKPSEQLDDFKKENDDRYADFAPDDRALATLMNLVHMVGAMLDEIDDRLNRLEAKSR